MHSILKTRTIRHDDYLFLFSAPHYIVRQLRAGFLRKGERLKKKRQGKVREHQMYEFFRLPMFDVSKWRSIMGIIFVDQLIKFITQLD